MSDNDLIRRGDALAIADKWSTLTQRVFGNSGPVIEIAALPATPQSHSYIGKDGVPILARDLENQRDDVLARVAELEAACALSGVTLLVETLKYCARDDGTHPENRKRAAKDVLAKLKGGE
jgi:hypothetical protein